ncbi:hypothetical protein ACV1DW_00070 [Aeromonas hydrophila]
MFNDDSMLQAIRGWGWLRVRQHLKMGRWVLVSSPRLYLCLPSRARTPAKMRALMDCLIEKRALLT